MIFKPRNLVIAMVAGFVLGYPLGRTTKNTNLKEKNDMERIKKEQLVDIASTKTGLTQKQTRDTFDAIFEAVEESLMAGYGVKLGDIGYLRIKKMHSKPERMGIINIQTLERGMLPAVPEYNAIGFKVNSRIKKDLREKTLGNVYEE